MRLTAAVVATLLAIALPLDAQCTAPGHERWTVKTMAPAGTKPKPITLAKLATLAPPGTVTSGAKGVKNSETRYPDTVDGYKEGELVSVTGWVRYIKLSDNDCDFHIQLTPDHTSNAGMVIVEIPDPDANHVSSAALRAIIEVPRTAVPTDLNLKPGQPHTSGNTIGSAYMTFEGALFFDAPHYPNCGSRGSGMDAATCWEVHPVTAARFAARPK